MIDEDTLLSREDILAICKADKEERAGKLVSLEELKKKLKLRKRR